jgi:hypothetical protein
MPDRNPTGIMLLIGGLTLSANQKCRFSSEVGFSSLPIINVFKFSAKQYCGSRSGIRCLFDPWIRDRSKIKIRIWDPDPG